MSFQATSSPRIVADAQGRRLESWKEIAAYLGHDVTTVRRWEKREGLPVHRLHHGLLGSRSRRCYGAATLVVIPKGESPFDRTVQ